MLYFIAAWAGLQCLTARLEGGQQEDQMSLEKLLNLQITTAAKFTPEGGAIDVFAAESDGGVVIGVMDTGIGIGPEFLESVFEPFFQVKSGIQEKTPFEVADIEHLGNRNQGDDL